MVFSSLSFIFLFLPIFLFIYYIVPNKFKNFILLIFSLLFYSWGEPIYILLLLFSSIVDYSNGFFINKFYDNKMVKKIFLIVSIIVNLGLLGIFKYLGFIVGNLNLLGFGLNVPDIALPLGISFFTFQTMSYSIDVYKGNIKYEKNFINFMAYVSMFPQLVAGPIVRYSDIKKELDEKNLTFKNFYEGLFRFLTGLFKKVIIANNMGLIFSLITGDISGLSLASAWLGAVSFTLQIYFDFSGYSDMAIGLGKMIGYSYPENFNYPYISKTITEFWRRWHISLSSFFRDYVYIPLGGNRKGSKRQILNMFIVWSLTGLWHGASWNFIIWGLYFFIILVIEKYITNDFPIPIIIRRIVTLFLIIIGWVIFAFDDIGTMILYLKSMFINNSIIDSNFIFFIKNYFVFIIFGILFSTPIVKKFKNYRFNRILCGIIYLILFIYTVSCLVADTYNPFLYFRF